MGQIQSIAHLIDYHSYWIQDDDGDRVVNPKFTRECGQILDLKNATAQGHTRAVALFAQRAEAMLTAHSVPPQDLQVHVVLVPSSTRGSWCPGLLRIGEYLCRRNRNFVDSMKVLERTTPIQKLARGGDRSVDVHLRSITVHNPLRRLAQKTILLLDDVTTTGNSLHACSMLLDQSGAARIMPLAMGRTV